MFHGLKLKINLNAFTAGDLAQTPLGSLQSCPKRAAGKQDGEAEEKERGRKRRSKGRGRLCPLKKFMRAPMRL